jgi:hypothetical protein
MGEKKLGVAVQCRFQVFCKDLLKHGKAAARR